jgi:hypothetical protein
MPRCASAWLPVRFRVPLGPGWSASLRERVGASFGSAAPLTVVVTRGLIKNNFTGPILASCTALTRLVKLYAPLPPCDIPANSGVRTGTLRHRALGGNRFSGSIPSSISALTALTYLYAPTFALPRVHCESASPRPASNRRWAAGTFQEIGSWAKCRRRSSRCASFLSCTNRRRFSALELPTPTRACALAASFRKRAARSRGTTVLARITPTTSACAWPGRCALLWRCQSAPPYSTRIRLRRTGRFVVPLHVQRKHCQQHEPRLHIQPGRRWTHSLSACCIAYIGGHVSCSCTVALKTARH